MLLSYKIPVIKMMNTMKTSLFIMNEHVNIIYHMLPTLKYTILLQ